MSPPCQDVRSDAMLPLQWSSHISRIHLAILGWKSIYCWDSGTTQIQLQISVFIIVFADLSGIFTSCPHGNLINSSSKLDGNAEEKKIFPRILQSALASAPSGLIGPVIFAAFLQLLYLTAKTADSPAEFPKLWVSIRPKDDKWGFHAHWWAHHENDIMV